jgi:hypothetical protein
VRLKVLDRGSRAEREGKMRRTSLVQNEDIPRLASTLLSPFFPGGVDVDDQKQRKEHLFRRGCSTMEHAAVSDNVFVALSSLFFLFSRRTVLPQEYPPDRFTVLALEVAEPRDGLGETEERKNALFLPLRTSPSESTAR